MDDFNLRMQQMHLHEQPEDRYRLTPKEALHELTQRVPNEDLRNALREEIKILAGDYDRLISMLQQRSEVLEQEYEHLRATEENYQNRYEKAVREMQFFKKKYEKAAEINKQYATINGNRQRSHSIESNISGLDSVHSRQNLNHSQYNGMPTSPPPSSVSGSELSTPYYNMPPPPIPPPTMENGKGIRYISRSSSSSTSSSGTPTPYWTNGVAHLPEHTPLPPIPHIRKNSTAAPSVYSAHSNHSAHSGGAESQITDPQGRFLHARKESWQSQPSSVLGAPIPSSTLSSNAIAAAKAASNSHQSADSMIQQRKVDPLSFGGSDPLWETIAKNQTTDSSIEKMISNFLRRGGSPNTAKQSPSEKTVKYGYGMIHALIAIKAIASLEVLLQQGANPLAITLSDAEEDKVTPGYLAASMGWIPGLQALVNHGCDLTLSRGCGKRGRPALHIAAENGFVDVVEFIMSQTPPRYHPVLDSSGASALHYACASGHTDLVSFLVLSCHLPVEQADVKGEVPLHWASRHGHLEVASFLIERCGCDFNSYVPRKVGTPYDIAKAGNHKRLVEYYKKLGAITAKKMDKRREEEKAKEVPVHLQSALSKNGLFGF